MQMTLATTDGRHLGIPLLERGRSRPLLSTDGGAEGLYPDCTELASASTDAAWSPSPSATSPGAWNEAPESHRRVVRAGADELLPFSPSPPA